MESVLTKQDEFTSAYLGFSDFFFLLTRLDSWVLGVWTPESGPLTSIVLYGSGMGMAAICAGMEWGWGQSCNVR